MATAHAVDCVLQTAGWAKIAAASAPCGAATTALALQ